MKRSAAELQGDQQELKKLLDYKQDEILFEEVSKLLGHKEVRKTVLVHLIASIGRTGMVVRDCPVYQATIPTWLMPLLHPNLGRAPRREELRLFRGA